ncbi:MAG TPA: DUF255 domain-containing protein, partial [Planctomycetota bacterium]|nr:DUF255 domain-containing protein [Planctomycetota bacterium]
HVMDRESYSDPAVAKAIGERFVAVRVDRDERPDVDARYQEAVAQLTGQSGWPLTAFLTPEGGLFFGGTYFPARSAGSSPGFLQILTWASELYASDPARRIEEAARLVQGLGSRVPLRSPGASDAAAAVARVVAGALDEHDPRFGGFGEAPKFLHANVLDLLLVAGGARGRDAALLTLRTMARGAIHDRLGGGFHRYAVDSRWESPHFEKLLGHNAEMLTVLARAAAVADDAELRRAAIGTARFLLETLQRSDGGFGESQDAGDGSAWLWTRAEVHAAAPDLAAAADALLEWDGAGPSPLRLAGAPRAGLEKSLDLLEERLRDAHARRAMPPVDGTRLPVTNALAASALVEASFRLGVAEWIAPAARALERLSLDGELRRAPGAPLLLEDAAASAEACARLFEATGDVRWRERAQRVAAAMERFFDPAAGAFVDRVAAAGEPLASWRRFPFDDSPIASGNAQALRALDRADALPDVANALASTTARAVAIAEPLTSAAAAAALHAHASAHTRAVVVAPAGPAREAFLAPLRRELGLTTRVVDAAATGIPDDLRPMADAAPPGGAVFLCRGTSCSPPVDEPRNLVRRLDDLRRAW